MSKYVTQMSKSGESQAYFCKDAEARTLISQEVTDREAAIAAETLARESAMDAFEIATDKKIDNKVDQDGNKQVTPANMTGIDSNILYMSNETVVESTSAYASKRIVNYTESLAAGDVFTILCDGFEGNTEAMPFAFYVANGDTEIRRSYEYRLEITTSDITAGADRVAVDLYPARGTAMPSGKATFKNVSVVKGLTENSAFGDDLVNAFLTRFTESNILAHEDKVTINDHRNYVKYKFCRYTGTFKTGDVFSFVSDDPIGAGDSFPFSIEIFHNGTSIRYEYNQGKRKDFIITDDDIDSGVDELIFYLYPAKGTPLPTSKAIYTNVYALKGSVINSSLAGELKEATENTITESNILFKSAEYVLRGDSNYIYRPIFNSKLTLTAGDVFSVLYDSVSGENTLYPQTIYIYNDDNLIRNTAFQRLEVTEADIASGANRIACALYPAKGTALPTGLAIYTNVRFVRGIVDGVGFANKAKVSAGGVVNTNGDIPSYYFTNDYLQNKVKTIKALLNGCAANGDAFIFITDEHIDYNQGHSPALINYIANKCKITRMFSGGDLADHGTEAFAEEYRKRFPYELHHACGNHEWMNPITGDALYYQLDMYNSNQIGNNEEHYYYVDNPQRKIRYVVLNSFVNNPDSSVLAAVSGYSAGQLAWFTDEALDLPDASWDVIIFAHYIGTYHGLTGSQDFMDAIDAFNSASTGGKILFILQGHTHYDVIYHTTGGVPIITTTCDKNMSWYQSGVNREEYLEQYRPSRTINEQAFDVVIVDRENSVAKLVRIGCPAYRNVDITPDSENFSYVPELEIRTVSF